MQDCTDAVEPVGVYLLIKIWVLILGYIKKHLLSCLLMFHASAKLMIVRVSVPIYTVQFILTKHQSKSTLTRLSLTFLKQLQFFFLQFKQLVNKCNRHVVSHLSWELSQLNLNDYQRSWIRFIRRQCNRTVLQSKSFQMQCNYTSFNAGFSVSKFGCLKLYRTKTSPNYIFKN